MEMKVYITPEAKQKLDLYVEAVSGEISGLGRCTTHKGTIYIEDVYLLKQESGHSDTELDPEAVAELMVAVVNAKEDPAELKLWWHSHGSMGVFWSGTDEATAGKFGNGWMLSLVVNKKGESKCRLDVYDPVHLVCESAELAVWYPLPSKELKAAIEAEVKEKVSSKRGGCVVYPPYGGYTGNGYAGNGVGFTGNDNKGGVNGNGNGNGKVITVTDEKSGSLSIVQPEPPVDHELVFHKRWFKHADGSWKRRERELTDAELRILLESEEAEKWEMMNDMRGW
jgi:hypothetical protein